jgi:lipopolysaccharide/colanic/teichoic acid biosynthesis glycosyltransferase
MVLTPGQSITQPMYRKYFKRLLDIFLALAAFIILLPLLLIIAIVISIGFRGNPFFLHKRPGKNERIFAVIKFKTMNDKKDHNGNLLPDRDRLTPLGIFIRKTSIDELPQLINVIKGDMSLIGPRPLLVRYLPYYTQEERQRFQVRPGITGLAQVSGRNFITWEDKFRKDVEYVNNITFQTDLLIYWKTIKQVIKSEGVEVDPNSNPVMMALDIIREDRLTAEKN